MAELSFRNISKSYGETEVVAGFNLEVSNHEFIVFSGRRVAVNRRSSA